MVGKIESKGLAHCLIISANQVVTPYPVYPLGAACLVTALQAHGHQVCHFDILADGGRDSLEKYLRDNHFDLIGVSIRNLDSVDSAAPGEDYLDAIAETVRCVRQGTTAPVVLGGPAFSIVPEDLLAFLSADYGVIGEGEELLPWLATEIAAGRPPREKLFFAGQVKSIWRPSDLTPSTARYYLDHGGMLSVQTKRGCPHSCSYCSYPNIEGKQLRYREPEEVAEEIIHLRDHSGARYIFFADSFFNDNEGRFLEVAEALIRRKAGLPWCAFFRPQNLTRSDLQLMKRAGLAAMEMGTDAACDRTLAGIGKSFTFNDVLEVHHRVLAEEIPCAHFVMFGGPGEDKETLAEGLANLERLAHCVVFAFAGIRILPDTGIFLRAVADGVIEADQSLLRPAYYFSPLISQSEIVAAIEQSFSGHMDRVYPCHEFEQRIAHLHKLGHVGPLWDFILKTGRRR